MSKDAADDFGLTGDTISINVLGREVTAHTQFTGC